MFIFSNRCKQIFSLPYTCTYNCSVVCTSIWETGKASFFPPSETYSRFQSLKNILQSVKSNKKGSFAAFDAVVGTYK